MHPQYRAQRALDAVFEKVAAGKDAFATEKYHEPIAAVLGGWSAQLLESPGKTEALDKAMAADFSGASLKVVGQEPVRAGATLKVWRVKYAGEAALGREAFLRELRASMSSFSKMLTAEFQVTSIRAGASDGGSWQALPNFVETRVRFELVGTGKDFYREQRVGNWELGWELRDSGEARLRKWKMLDETRGRSASPVFVDVTSGTLGGNASYGAQLLRGTDYWRTVLDGACGIDVYGHNGVSIADIDGDGLDDLYICQPAGLPNRLYRNRGDGTFEDLTERSGLGILENTACALFADIDNDGRQDLIVVRADGPALFLNEGGGKFQLTANAFQFANAPQGAFTGAAIADYDRDGWLDVYFCLYAYYQGAGQYRYPSPYFDAENGPPNFLMRNNGDGTFRDATRESGMDRNNTRYSFCCAWGDSNGDGWPDLYVVNDFGRKNLYRNKGDGTFTDVAAEAGVDDVGAGMSACWLDYDNDGKQDLYVANMWTAAGLRIAEQENFQGNAGAEIRSLYRKHAMGNSLFRNGGGARFEDKSGDSATAMGRWAWCSDAWDFDGDGFPDIYIANGMISGSNREELNSFFWRQVVANSPKELRPNDDYEQGWSAINELIRSDGTWSGYERNVLYRNNGDGTFCDVSGISGMDFVEDSRSFALGDLDQDGRLEVVLKNRNAPQVRILKNTMKDAGSAIAFRLRGRKSNRDAIGAAVTVETGIGRQTRWLQAGSGFLAQHSKELFVGLGESKTPVTATIRWPSGLTQNLRDLPMDHRIWIEEGSAPARMEPFRKAAAVAAREAMVSAEVLPSVAETWLLAPVAAPDFSLPDASGHEQSLSTFRGKPVLLHFCSAESGHALAEFERAHVRWAKDGLQLLTVVVNEAGADREKAASPYPHFTFPILRASADVVAIYNIFYRYIFDRHRDLTLPASFLIDAQGVMVKIYQGPVDVKKFETDFRNIPRTPGERVAKALPFPGISEGTEYGRNYLSIGSVFFERGYLEQAEFCFQQALRDEPSSAEAYYGLGSVYLQQQKNALARENFERCVRLQASYPGTVPRAWSNLGILAAREGSSDEAVRNFRRALEIAPDYEVAWVNLGSAYRQKKDWKEAGDALRQALALKPEDPEANYGLGMVFAQLGESEQAHLYIQKALAARPVYPEALNNLGVLYLRTNRAEDAERSFQEAIRVAPAFELSYLNLARLYAIEGDSRKARAVLLELLKQHPGHVQAEKELSELPQ